MRKDSKNKEYVFNRAKDIVMEQGLSSLTIRGLAKSSNVSVGTIYNMFGTKEELIIELIKDYWEESISVALSKSNLQEGNCIEKIKSLTREFTRIIGQFHRHWIIDVEDIRMSNERIYKLSSKYKELINNRIEEILLEDQNIKNQFNDVFTSKKVAEVIQDMSINKIKFEESDLDFLEVFLCKLFDIKKV